MGLSSPQSPALADGGLQRPWAWLLFALAVLAVPALAMWRQAQAPEPPPHLGLLPDYALIDQAGQPSHARDLLGDIVLVDFIFTRCPDICPTLSTQMAAIADTLGERPFDGPALRLVSISVDPSFDRPEVLAAYGQGYGARLPQWRLLTGESEAIDQLLASLAQTVDRLGETEDGRPKIAHSQRILLVDPQGEVRAFHPIDAEGLEALARDIEALANEAR